MNIPKQFMVGIKKGFLQACNKGILSGNKVAGVKFRLIDGASHCVDSSELAFMLAAEGAVKDVYQDGAWVILEPIMAVEVTAPEEFQVRNIIQIKMFFKYKISNPVKNLIYFLHFRESS